MRLLPNILLITTDQQRWDAVAANGNAAIRTPQLDRLAASGLRFTNSFCAGAACQPSRASILTGVMPSVHGIRHTGIRHWLPPELPTLPGLLGQQGYRTVGIGKMHFHPWDELSGFQRRVIIESKYSPAPDEYRRYVHEHGLQPQVMGHHVPGFGRANKGMPSPLPENQHIDAFIGRRAVETLDELATAAPSSPFFAWVSFCGPHDPYDPPAPYDTMFRPENMPLPRRVPGELDRLPPVVREKSTAFGIEKMDLWGIPDAEIQRLRALYYGNVALIDVWIGRILDLLRDRGLAENTLVIFSSDHGDYLGDHDALWKALLPCGADMRVPLLVAWPGQVPAGVCPAFASGIDILPTALAAAGLCVPQACPGQNLVALAAGRLTPRSHLVLYSEPDKWHYRSEYWAYTQWPGQPFDTLFNLDDDPWELDNLCAPDRPPAPAEQVAEFRRAIAAVTG